MNSFDSVECMRHILMNEGIKDEEVLSRTPERWVKALRDLIGTNGPNDITFTTFPSDSEGMVVEQDIPFSSLCSHHLLPFFGHAHIAYVPQGRIAGLSKLARVVQVAALGLWTQEELTEFIADTLETSLTWKDTPKGYDAGKEPFDKKPLGVGVIMRAEHTCMSVRGIKAVGAVTTTSSMKGVFADHSRLARAEFLGFVK